VAEFIPDIFLKFPGADGECKVEGYTSTIAVLDYHLSLFAATTIGHGSGQSGGRGTCTPISIKLVHDKGYAKLRRFAGQGKTISSGVVLTRTADGQKDEEISLSDVKVISANSSHGSGGQNEAWVILSFGQAVVTTYVESSPGAFSVGDSTTFDMTTGQTE
jgi:type VI protein secretion system component Hcp